jgi:hypothetical protein
MALHHLTTNIEGILKQNDEMLGNLFDMDGKEARTEILELQKNGDKYIGSENCKHFDPKHGCLCRFYDEVGAITDILGLANHKRSE